MVQTPYSGNCSKQCVYRESNCRSTVTVRSRGYIVWNLIIRKNVMVECLHMFKCILTHKLRMMDNKLYGSVVHVCCKQ